MIVEIYLINRNYVKHNTISTLFKIKLHVIQAFLKLKILIRTKIKCIES